jgi:GR25 family glycosyltransferase involved in LPS biosynthesis
VYVSVLSLPDAFEKRKAITRELLAAGINFVFQDGVDGRISPIPRDVNSLLTPPEAACSLGHIRIYQELLASDQGWALVFEDDVNLAPDFSQVLNLVNSEVLPALDHKPVVVLLGGQDGIRAHFFFVGVQWGFAGRHKILRSFRSEKFLFRTCGYLINRKAAQGFILANQGLIYRADDWVGFKNRGALDDIYLLRPGIVSHPRDLTASAIQEQRSESQSFKTPFAWLNAMLRISLRLPRFLYLTVLARLQ